MTSVPKSKLAEVAPVENVQIKFSLPFVTA